MKKRATSMLLAFALFVGMLSMIPIKANAAWTAEYSPYPKIESSYSSGVSCGTVRYISQISGSTYFYSAYWPSGAFGGYSSPGWECGTASISMALSYVGVNKTPKAILEANNGYTYFTGWGPSTSSPSVSTGMNNYINGNGKYSPVIIHLPNYSSDGHWVVLIGKVSSNVYYVLDPANAVCWNITINGTSATYTKNGYTINDTIDRTYQYYNSSAVIESDDYLSKCTPYPTYCDIKITSSSCYVKSLPCSESTNSGSGNIEKPSVNTVYRTTQLYKNSAGNYWYKVTSKSGKTGYIYAGDCSISYKYVDVGISGANAPTQITEGSAFSIGGVVSSSYSRISSVAAYVYTGSNLSVAAVTGSLENVDTTSYSLKGSTVDKGVLFSILSAGSYTYVVRATAYGYYATSTTTMEKYSSSEQLYSASFSVVHQHNYTSVVTQPTCTAQGYTTHTCSSCGNSYKDTYTAALGHNYTYKVTTTPTTSASGKLTGTCSRCNGTTTVTLPKLSTTDYSYKVTKEATCTATGAGRYTWKTSTYGCFYFDVTIAKTAHNYISIVTAPTCTVQGYTTHTCSACGNNYIDAYKEALGHSWNQGVVTKEPTETETGEKLFTCIRCTATRTETIPMLDHSHSYSKTVFAPTCTEQGYTEYTCSCGDTYTADIISAIGHIWNDGAVTKEPTGCDTLTGEITYTCNSCGEMRTEFFARGHNFVTDPAVTPTCTEAGLTEGIHCSLCNELVKAQETVPALGHSYVDAVTQPTCTQNGYTLHTCSVCSESYTDATVAPLGHTWNGGVVMRVATCTANGKMKYTCTVCGAEKEEVIIATGHNYMDTVIRPTCTETGYTTHTCSNCGDNYKDTYVGATGHAWNNGIVAIRATCTKAGEKVFTCGNCGETRLEEIPALGHSYEAVVTEPTCTEAGFTTYTCGSCGDSYVTDEVEALGHNYEAVVTEPTCTEAGFTTYTCSVCGDRYVADEVEVLGHNYETIVTEPTCTESGFTTYTCAFCGDSYIADETVALGHAWDDGTVTIEPTATEAGVMTYTCTREGCGETKTEEIPALGEDPDEPCDGGEDCPSAHFTDIHATDWYHEAVDFAVENGLFGGMSENTFEPNTAMTRAMLVTVLWRYAGEPMEGENTFTDVPAGQWYTDAVAWAAENNIVGGVGDNKFDPNGNITREQMATILYRYAGGKDIDTSARADLSSFPDAGSVSSYANDPICWAVAEGLINGSDGKLLPQGNATRAQVATILMRFIENIAE